MHSSVIERGIHSSTNTERKYEIIKLQRIKMHVDFGITELKYSSISNQMD